jgi:hypothetical protein
MIRMDLSDATICPCCGLMLTQIRKHLTRRDFKNPDGSIAKKDTTPCAYRHSKHCKGLCMKG